MADPRQVWVQRDGTLLRTQTPPLAVDALLPQPGALPALLALRDAGYQPVLIGGGQTLPAAVSAWFDAWLAAHGLPDLPVIDGADPPATLLTGAVARTRFDREHSVLLADDRLAEVARTLGLPRLALDADHSWPLLARELTGQARRARVTRRTKETAISVEVDLDAEGPQEISTGIGFYDHMLEQIAKHGGFALKLSCQGDLHIDEHHTVEDCALALGSALDRALGERRGIGRYGFLLPMDETRAEIAIDLGGRPYAVFEGDFPRNEVGGLSTEMVPHFFRSLAETLRAAIHVRVWGENTHHMVEASFKGVGRALRQAFTREGRELPSTKGVL
ncbi:MAG: imidazoleglycerol-phosphate dehydratase HisB [Gammaproteobacteria bacterium]|nr:MAG: imidazoleglycerol-phosphate dehydratase HisB [Gammaproteobacteria bacterium]